MPQSRSITGLKEADRQLLHLLALGLSESEAARVMGRGIGAIHTRGSRIREYSGTKTQAHMVYWALDNYEIPAFRVDEPSKLRPHHIEVISLIARGFTNSDAGMQLHIETSTVVSRMRKALDLSGALNCNHLVALAWSEDLFV